MSMTPAFSPGPWITHGPLVGSVRRWTLEDLYEQCSFHIAEKMPSSVSVGSRPIRSSMRWYSSGLRPCSATSSGVMRGSLGITRVLTPPVARASTSPANSPRPSVTPIDGFDVVFRMRHHAEHVAALVDDAGDGVDRAVVFQLRIDHAVGRAIAEQHPPLAFQPRDGLAVGDVIALAMRDRHADHLPGIVAAGERRVGALDPQINVAADEAQLRVAHQHARQQPGLAQNLKAVADAEHQPAAGGMRPHRVHDRRARRDRAAAQIVAVGEAAGDHHQIGAGGQARFRRARPWPARGRRRAPACAPCRARD